MLNPKSIFISKNINGLSHLLEYINEQNLNLIAESFLEFSKAPFTIQRPFDLIFFGSPRAVKYYLTECPKTSSEVACSGDSTARVLKTYGYNPTFNGGDFGSISLASEAFRAFAKEKHVLFPISNISLKTFSNRIEEAHKEEIIVYNTSIVSKKIAQCDVYFFTSPSNVRGFHLENDIPDAAVCFAWGESTSKELENYKQEHHVVDSSSEESAVNSLRTLLGK